jgi:DNA-binding MarR family transcriptional regulator
MFATHEGLMSSQLEGDSSARASHSAVFHALRRIMRAMDSHSRYLAQHHGLTGPQALVLQELRRLGDVPAGQLAQQASLSQATLTGILDRLTTKKLVERRRDPLDKRRVLVHLTADGIVLLQVPPPPFKESFLEQFNSLQDWERGLILSTLQRVAAMMEKAGDLQVKTETIEVEEEG